MSSRSPFWLAAAALLIAAVALAVAVVAAVRAGDGSSSPASDMAMGGMAMSGGTAMSDHMAAAPTEDVPSATATRGGTPPAADAGLVNYASRFGVSANIRQVLAQEDYDYRSAHQGKLLERWMGLTTYYAAYEPFSLDAWAEIKRWRKVNAATPSAPPAPEFIVQ